jgi:hypothetical protein
MRALLEVGHRENVLVVVKVTFPVSAANPRVLSPATATCFRVQVFIQLIQSATSLGLLEKYAVVQTESHMEISAQKCV